MLRWYYSNPLNHADKVNSITISLRIFCSIFLRVAGIFLTLGVWTFVTFDVNFTSYLSGINVPSHLKEIWNVITSSLRPWFSPILGQMYTDIIYICYMIWKHIFHFLYHISISINLVTVLLLLLSILLYQYINIIFWCVYIISVV